MVAYAFHHRAGTGVTYAEAFSCHTVYEYLTAGSAVEGNISDNDVLIRFEFRTLGRIYHQLSAGKTFSEVVIAVTGKGEGKSLGNKSTKALSAASMAFDDIGIILQGCAVSLCNFRTQDSSKGTVDIGYLCLDSLRLAGSDGALQFL